MSELEPGQSGEVGIIENGGTIGRTSKVIAFVGTAFWLSCSSLQSRSLLVNAFGYSINY